MLRVTVGVLAVVLAGSASAAGWRSLRIDATSEASFNASVTALQDKLPRVRRQVFEESLKDIWEQGTKAAAADAREYAITDYLRDVDGLGYKEVVTFTDSTGDTADRYFRATYASLFGGRASRDALSGERARRSLYSFEGTRGPNSEASRPYWY